MTSSIMSFTPPRPNQMWYTTSTKGRPKKRRENDLLNTRIRMNVQINIKREKKQRLYIIKNIIKEEDNRKKNNMKNYFW